ncbi:hypothetical protein PAHAL_9G198500 [Panicum hallii]|uniref:Uncharacterized protein n=1 Tax=Panicum hallii TaxID=206008 RepID=A0A2T8I1W8_9POAL|nr:hypothetical protein PAHAL_9G198500 [Panicum hallii]
MREAGFTEQRLPPASNGGRITGRCASRPALGPCALYGRPPSFLQFLRRFAITQTCSSPSLHWITEAGKLCDKYYFFFCCETTLHQILTPRDYKL